MMKIPAHPNKTVAPSKYLFYMMACVTLVLSKPLYAQQPNPNRGEGLFVGYCSRCHGVGGTGGEGPTLQGRQFARASNESDLVRLILTGISGTAMSRTWVTRQEAREMASYVWSLARVDDQPVTGNSSSGRDIFFGIGGCGNCHIVKGQGIGIGPDLSNVGARRGLPFLRESVLAPGASIPKSGRSSHSSFLAVSVEMNDGKMMRGMRINEDAFILNLRDTEGTYYMLQKEEVRRLTREFGESIMPGYGSTLSTDEITDLVAYMASLR